MAIHDSFDELAKRLDRARKFGQEELVKRGNKCAMVMGITLRMQPRKGETSMRDLLKEPTFAAKNMAKKVVSKFFADGNYDEAVTGPDMPFMDRFYVKAKDLAKHIEDDCGEADIAGRGKELVGSGKLAGQKGVMYLGGFWHGGSGDHIDLWDGRKLLITGTPQDSQSEIGRSKEVLFWRVQK
jgi:hypothetical protein